ncbi:hypothetical protein [Clostridium sp. C8-1-8]|uniref:hypothetical protein n=1 Tax=Clostridium sp. C8-1-8 TaxID=2698831 RepID=UPI00136DC9B4|nr:hypothetical protein [Clostridium sp. C8-1-8]
MKNKLLDKIEQLGGMNSTHDILVSIDDFFEGNTIEYSFAANACDTDFNVNEFYNIFKKIKDFDTVQDIWIMITDVDEEWPYSDTAFIALNNIIQESDINEWLGKGYPSEIREVNLKDEPSIPIPYLKDGYKLLSLWWD